MRRCDCGKNISDRSTNAKRCKPCGTAHKLEYDRIYNRNVRPNGLQPHKKSVAGRVKVASKRCICCGNLFRPTETRTRLCLECWSGGDVVEYSIGVAV